MTPAVSIIMPAFNAERYIRESLQSALDQSVEDCEMIVIDDGSTDATPEVVAGVADRRIRYFRRENGGPASARNTGLNEARGSFVAFLDADDLWLPNKLELQLRRLHETNADLVYCDGYAFFEDGSPDDADFFAVVAGRTDGPQMFKLLYSYNRIATQSVVFRREIIERVGSFDEAFRVCEDYDLWLRLALAGCSFYGMTEKLFRYRRHIGSSTYRASKLLAPMIRVVKKHSDAVDARTAQARIRGLYRELITALINENDLAGAREAMRGFAAWDRTGVITLCQRVILRFFPTRFAGISRAWLYPTEWHLTRFMDKFTTA